MIRLLVLDVDGTLTDGGIYYDSTGNELKKFGVKDGAGLVLARTAGIRVMICTGRRKRPRAAGRKPDALPGGRAALRVWHDRLFARRIPGDRCVFPHAAVTADKR